MWYHLDICRLRDLNFGNLVSIALNHPLDGSADAENYRHCENRMRNWTDYVVLIAYSQVRLRLRNTLYVSEVSVYRYRFLRYSVVRPMARAAQLDVRWSG